MGILINSILGNVCSSLLEFSRVKNSCKHQMLNTVLFLFLIKINHKHLGTENPLWLWALALSLCLNDLQALTLLKPSLTSDTEVETTRAGYHGSLPGWYCMGALPVVLNA